MSKADSARQALVGLGLLCSAFAPLAALIAVLRWRQLGLAAWLLAGVCVASLLLLFIVVWQAKRVTPVLLEPAQVRRSDETVVAFASNYVVPVVVAAFGDDKAVTLAAAIALFVILVIIYWRGELFHLNPTLALCGYRLYEVTCTNGTVTKLLTKRRYVKQHAPITCYELGSYAAIE